VEEITVVLPKIASREEWLAARLELLAKEKELSRAQAALADQRRALPMVEIDKNYTFTGPPSASGPGTTPTTRSRSRSPR
jgi:predicted dithiol-disulfide oxidoreductase (DUF899 family)